MYLFNGILEPMKYYSMQSFPDVFEQGGSFLLNDYLRLMISGSYFEKAALYHEILKCRGWKGLQMTQIPHFQAKKSEIQRGSDWSKFIQHINGRCKTSYPDA